MAGGIIIAVLGYISTTQSLRIIDTPESILPLARTYMHIFYLGAPALVLFNMGSGILRAIGDSRHPFYFLIISALLNIVLDILFVGYLGMGVEGAAYATIISEAISMVLTLSFLHRSAYPQRLQLRSIGFTPSLLKPMLQIGCPAGIQSIMYTISNLIIQSHINAFGTDTAAAWAAYGKLDGFFWMSINAFGLAVMTFMGQNYGAGKIDRMKKGVRDSILMATGGTIIMTILFCTCGTYLYRMFTSDEAVINIGMHMLYTIAPTFITYIFIEILSGAIRGAGKALLPTLFCILGICALRILWLIFFTPIFPSLTTVLLCYPVSWIVTSALFIGYYHKGSWLLPIHHSFHGKGAKKMKNA